MAKKNQSDLFNMHPIDSLESLPVLTVTHVMQLLSADILNKNAKISDRQKGLQIYYSVMRSERELNRDNDNIKPMSININIRDESEDD